MEHLAWRKSGFDDTVEGKRNVLAKEILICLSGFIGSKGEELFCDTSAAVLNPSRNNYGALTSTITERIRVTRLLYKRHGGSKSWRVSVSNRTVNFLAAPGNDSGSGRQVATGTFIPRRVYQLCAIVWNTKTFSDFDSCERILTDGYKREQKHENSVSCKLRTYKSAERDVYSARISGISMSPAETPGISDNRKPCAPTICAKRRHEAAAAAPLKKTTRKKSNGANEIVRRVMKADEI
ncbi:hypothetical protein TcasGA2_TC000353 [Tribolium castaneum]|uniref:Uncharacterized protein n=1 Tax=Tribolium castaneum TaxID=7070 RepID=D6WAR5_TRICA|nr:hypothetical protein TcasGA2_TC000353 [Tribolium castaneum]